MTLKNPFAPGIVFDAEAQIEYSEGGVISKQIMKSKGGNVTVFSFDQGQGLSEHTAPFDALVEVIDGKVEITIDGVANILESGQSIIMPAEVPHALYAVERFKMLLTMIKG